MKILDDKNLDQDECVNESCISKSEKTVEDQIENKDTKDKGMKKISVTDLSISTKIKLQKCIEGLTALGSDILIQRSDVIDKKTFIRSKVKQLNQRGQVSLDENELKKSEESVGTFVKILENVAVEVDREIKFYLPLFSDDVPQHVVGLVHESDVFEVFILNRIKLVRRYIKTVKNHLVVGFSRYCYGFEVQIRQIAYIEQVVKRMDRQKST